MTTEATAVVTIPLELLTAEAPAAEMPAAVEVVVTLTQFEIVIKPVTDLVYCVVRDCIDQWHSIRCAPFPTNNRWQLICVFSIQEGEAGPDIFGFVLRSVAATGRVDPSGRVQLHPRREEGSAQSL